MDENIETERTTRSGRKISGPGKALKRKRTPDIDNTEPECTKAKMSGKEKDGENCRNSSAGLDSNVPNLSSVNFM